MHGRLMAHLQGLHFPNSENKHCWPTCRSLAHMRGLTPLPVFAIADLKDQWALDIDRGSDLYLTERNPLGGRGPALYFRSWCSRMASRTSRRSPPPFRCCRTEIVHRPCL